MKKIFSLLFLILLLTGCGSKPPVPSWIAAGHQQLENYKQDLLTGRSAPITEIHFRSALEEIKKGGDIDLLGKASLTRMALQIAVLREPEEADYLKVEAVESVAANRQYYLFLKGERLRRTHHFYRKLTVFSGRRCVAAMPQRRQAQSPRSMIPYHV